MSSRRSSRSCNEYNHMLIKDHKEYKIKPLKKEECRVAAIKTNTNKAV